MNSNNNTDSKSFMSGLIGDRAFYSKVLKILVPMVIQMGITNFVNLLDNVMVGQLGTASISGVAVANQLVFVFNIMMFGIIAGASIYGAQYFGKGDYEGFRQTFRFRIYTGVALGIAAWLIFSVFGRQLFIMYLGGDTEVETITYAGKYMAIICWQLIPFMLDQGIGGALKDCGETRIPMRASVLAILTNLVLNYILIYGKFGAPAMGIEGAALATVIARYLSVAFLLVQIARNREKLFFMEGAFRRIDVSPVIVKSIVVTGTPLFLNETFWSIGITMTNACYAIRGIQAVAATNINQTLWNLFGVICMSMGSAIGIIAGQQLGANDFEGAKDSVRKVVVMSIFLNIIVGIGIILISPFIPLLYNTETEVRVLATQLLRVCGFMMPVIAYTNICYFVLRSGGKTGITFLFDSGYTWGISLPAAWCLSHYTSMGVLMIYVCVQALEFVKVAIGAAFIKSGIWVNNILPD